ncbi:fibronectin type III domain-containing protein [Vibrio parahaemolyticus]|uniref:fibronectin type III domain-containing protein n=1 Tax=Vibrio parahaemolyticus TaxID=670 RepID=UPI00100F5C28|nr:fibronectin type III domain-containing protein [Vibrio parahaemolyticus]RXP62012.1 fibronectin type III domain-containing protein [Vibrio parahaemolyticus]RXP63733.1 fibronectin type III domain-containing protein [Vibrio parahaemolyticus]RXP73871.1 fibronectin type III domain-containing protein [Vibrio parahaemolyticus]RXP77511.1 fibronectin type III domain-containing protein [Vibrio parahaemolyticus]RXP98393.1 fibronectin type III domain-containing protein [Vibrio parahaemolyticus]
MGLEAATIAWISVAVSVGTSVYAMTMTPDLDKKNSNAGTKITKNGTQSPRNRVYGTAIVGCTSVYSNVLDRDRSYRLDVFSVGGIGELTLHNVWIDDVRMFEQNLSYNSSPYDASSGIFNSGQMRPRYRKSDKFQMQWRSGHENQVAAQLAVDNSDGEWTTDHKGSKVPHIVIFADYTTDQDYVFFSDRYNITALVTGGAVYDPREADNDFEVPTTWTGKSSNVALAVYDYLTSNYYGLGIKPEYIDEASFAYAASFCDANGLEINSAIRADDSFAEILQDMLICCGGSLVISNGKIKFLVEEQELVALYDLDDDLIIKDSLKVSPASTSDYYNVVSTTFKSEINRDNDDDFIIPADVTTDERVLQDGEVITKSIKMPYSRDAFESEGGVVNNGVKYITNVIYNKANFQSTVTFDLDLHAFPMLEPLSVVSITNEAYGFNEKKFRVLSMEISTDSDRFNIARINAIEYDDSIYTGTLGGATSLPRPRPLDEIQPPKNLTFNLEAFVISGYGLLRWEHGSFTPSTAYDIEYRLATQTEWTRYRSAHKGDNIAMYDLKGDTYDFRVRTYDTVLGTSEWVELSSIEVAPNYTLPAVTNLKVDTSTPHFRFTWDDMSDVTVDNMPDPTSPTSGGSTGRVADIFKHYRVQLHVDGVLYVNETLTTNQFTFFYEDNKALFGTAKREVTLTVVMVDKYGVTSAQNSLVASNDQLGVATGIKTTNTNGNATIEWEPRNEPDFEGTLIFVSSVSGFTPSDSNLHAVLGKESFYVYNFDSEDKSDRYMRIAHFDTMGRDSVTYSPEIVLSFNGAMDAKLIRLISESQVFAIDKYGTPSRDSITFTASTQNTTGDVTWTVNPSVALTTTANPNERVLSYSNMGNHEQVTVTVSCDGVTDVVSIYKVRDGQDGKDGQDGQDGQNGQNGQDGKDGDTIYEQYRYGQVVTPDASWTQWGEDMRSTDIYRQTRLVTNGVGGNPGTVHRISGIDGNNGQDGERVFVIYHKNPVGIANRPSTPTNNWANEGWSEDSQDAHWMSQKVAKAIDEELTFWSFPIALTGDKGEDGVVDYNEVDNRINTVASQVETTFKTYTDSKVGQAESNAKAHADNKATVAENNAINRASAALDSRIPAAQAEKLGNITGSSGLSFYKRIVVNGDADTYYPVIVHGGHQDVLRTIKIWRRYNETAPNTWNTSTHRGALMFTWLGNFGGWGGARYRSTILEYGEVYSNMIAHCYRYNHSQAMVFFLRGGGAVYHMGSDQTLDGVERENPSGGGSGIYYSSSIKSFVSSYSSSSDVYAPAPMSSPDLDALRDQMKTQNSLGQYIKNLNADNITAGKVSAQYVQADVYDGTLVNASNINVGQLNAKHINTETFTGTSALFGAEVQGGTITGAVVRTSSSGARAEMRETGYKFAAYDDNGNPTFYVENDGSVVMKAGRIESDVLDTIGSSSNIVSWVGETARGGEIKIDRSNIINNTVEYFPLPAFITTGEVGLLTARLFSSEGLLIQNEQSANWGEPAPAQKTLASTDSPRIHLVNTSNGVLTDLGYMKISYTTQSGNGTYNEKYNTGTYGWRKTYAHFYLEGVPADFKVSGGTNLQNYKVRVLTSHMATGDTLRAQAATFDTLEYVEQSVGGRYLPHSYKVVWEGYATTVTNEWGEGLYLIIGMDKGDWRRWGFVFVADKNENVDLYAYEDEARTIFATYSAAYVEYRYDTNIFRNSEGYVCKILKLTGR